MIYMRVLGSYMCCPQGPKGHGYYFIRAEPSPEGKWEGVRCELQLDATTELEEEQFRDKRCFLCRYHSSICFDFEQVICVWNKII